MKKSRLLGTIFFFILTCLFSSLAMASLITLMHTGSGSGTIGAISFTNADFVITATGDTSEWTLTYSDLDVEVYSLTHDSATITIDGVGTTSFLISTKTFFDNSLSSPFRGGLGFGWAPPIGTDLFDKQNDEQIIPTWDLISSYGPYSFKSALLQWTPKPVVTDLGVLVFDRDSDIPSTFQASVIPIPAAAWLFGSGLIGLIGIARRKKA